MQLVEILSPSNLLTQRTGQRGVQQNMWDNYIRQATARLQFSRMYEGCYQWFSPCAGFTTFGERGIGKEFRDYFDNDATEGPSQIPYGLSEE